MNSEGSSAFHFAPATEYIFFPTQLGGHLHQDQQQLPPPPDSRGSGCTSNGNYLEQHAQDIISTPDSGPAYPNLPHRRPAVAGPARPASPAPVGFAPNGTRYQLNQPFTTNYRLVAPPHQHDNPYNSAAHNNSPSWFHDGAARTNDGSSPFASGRPMQGHSLATTTHALSAEFSPGSLSLSSPSASSPQTAAEREKPHECELCPSGRSRFTSARDLRRHQDTSHKNDNTPMYFCWCAGRGSATPRKDNHLRHVHSCNRQPLYGACYNCICGIFNSDKQVHLSHVQNCGRTRR